MGLPHDKLPVLENFCSIQGEGVNLGMPYYFIRVGGCPLRCTNCDSEYTWTMKKESLKNVEMVAAEAIHIATKNDIKWISITGGEPLLYPSQLNKMMELFQMFGMKTHIETSGRFWDSVVHRMCDIYSVDAKTPCTNETMHGFFKGMSALRPQDQVKCLIHTMDDLMFANEVNFELDGRCTMVLQPFNTYVNSDVVWVRTSMCQSFKALLDMFHKSKLKWKKVILTPQVHVLAHGNKPST